MRTNKTTYVGHVINDWCQQHIVHMINKLLGTICET